MKRRRILLLAALGAIVVVLAVIAVLLLTHPAHALDRAHYRRLAPGMTEAEVQDVLGGRPPGRAISGIVLMELIDEEGANPGDTSNGGKSRLWASNQGQIGVVFDADGRLRSKQYFVPTDDWPSKLNGWFGR